MATVVEQEKARLAAKRQAAWAEAEAEFDAWYRDLGTRADRHTGGNPGRHKDKIVQYGPRCSQCGKATAALGLCMTHYSRLWRANHPGYRNKTGRTRLKDRPVLCPHKGAVHHGRGVCKACYERLPDVRHKKQARKKNLQLLKAKKKVKRELAWRCSHKRRKHKARGLCDSCYTERYMMGNLDRRSTRVKASNTQKPAPKLKPRKVTCKHNRPHHARGLCLACYNRYYLLKHHGAKLAYVRAYHAAHREEILRKNRLKYAAAHGLQVDDNGYAVKGNQPKAARPAGSSEALRPPLHLTDVTRVAFVGGYPPTSPPQELSHAVQKDPRSQLAARTPSELGLRPIASVRPGKRRRRTNRKPTRYVQPAVRSVPA